MRFVTFCLLALAFIIPGQAYYYVRQENPSTKPDGSLNNPFNSLEQAVKKLGAGNFEVVLLGSHVKLTSVLAIPSKSNYLIRADDKKVSDGVYFPLKLERGAAITISKAKLTLKNIQIIELDKNRSPEAPALKINSGSLTLKKVLVTDISCQENIYTLLSSTRTQTDTQVIIEDSIFRNLENVKIELVSTKLTISNTIMSQITQTTGMFLSLDDNDGLVPDMDISLQNILIENSVVKYNEDDNEPTTFMGFFMSTANLNFEDLTIKNINIDAGSYFIQVANTEEDPTSPTALKLKNIEVRNVYEHETTSKSTGSGIVFNLYGASGLDIINYSAFNVQLQYKAMLFYAPNIPTVTYGTRPMLSSVTLKDIKIQDCKGANLRFDGLDNFDLEDADLRNNQFELEGGFPQFSLVSATNIVVKNLNTVNHHGPVFRSLEGPYQRFENCAFERHTTSQELPSTFQYIISITRKANDAKVKSAKDPLTLFKNCNIDGWNDIQTIDSRSTSNDSYAIMVRSEVGEVIIQDSKWTNIKMGGFLGKIVSSLKVDGLVVYEDSCGPQSNIPWHRLFQIVNADQVEVRNSKFLNLKNINIFNLYNIRYSSIYDTAKLPTFKFDGIIVSKNDIISAEANQRFMSLFSITSPSKPVKFIMTNSHLSHNKIASGLISAQESNRVDIDLVNNVFEHNYAQEFGAVLAIHDMQIDYSNIHITGNHFNHNICPKNGGVFAFLSSKLKIDSKDNVYTKNSAGLSGGVGYTYRAKTFYSEVNGLYTGNHAKVSGGDWRFDLGKYGKDPISLNFVDTLFRVSESNSQGGALYVVSGTVNLHNCVFFCNKATISGGDIYLAASANLNAKGVTFKTSSAGIGSVLFAETQQQNNIVIEDSIISNVVPKSVLVKANTGSFRIVNTQVSRITGSLFDINSKSVEFTGVSIKNINCLNSNSLCLLQGSFASFDFVDSQILNVVSTKDLILLGSQTKDASLSNLKVSNVRQSKDKIAQKEQMFIFRTISVPSVQLQDSSFTNLYDFSSFYSTGSSLTVSNTKFQRRVIAQNEDLLQRVTFLSLESSVVSIKDSSFITQGKLNNGLNGGAITIAGNGGAYNILNSRFEGNQAVEGGAISVRDNINQFNVKESYFRGNVANEEGGSIYFAPQKIAQKALINSSTFLQNQASQGGAVFTNNLKIAITNSIFKNNVATVKEAAVSFNGQVNKIDLSSNTFINN